MRWEGHIIKLYRDRTRPRRTRGLIEPSVPELVPSVPVFRSTANVILRGVIEPSVPELVPPRTGVYNYCKKNRENYNLYNFSTSLDEGCILIGT